MRPTSSRGGFAALAALFLLLPTLARADIAPPVKVEIIPPAPDDLPVQGEVYPITLRVTSAVDATLQDFTFSSSRLTTEKAYAWEVVSLGVPPGVAVPVTAMVPLDVPCELLANDPTVPVIVRFRYDNRTVANSFRLLPRYGLRGVLPAPAATKAWLGASPPPKAAAAYAARGIEPAPRRTPAPATISAKELAEDAPRDGDKRGSYTIHVAGQFLYRRLDGQADGVYGCTVRVMDEDDNADDELASTITDADGRFDVTFNYDMAEDPDIYLEMEAANSKIEVEDASVLENNYTWESSVRDDTTEQEFLYGSFTSEDEGLMPALHVLTTASRTLNWFLNAASTTQADFRTIDSVDIQWPEDGVDQSQYMSSPEHLIELQPEDGWQEFTIAHEYNHHVSHNFYPDSIDDYCNALDRCDTDDDCKHCMWCQESPWTAWGEGFGEYVASAFVRTLEPDYGLPPVYGEPLMSGNAHDLDSVQHCNDDGIYVYDDPLQVEGNVGALLLDIDDDPVDDNDDGAGHDELTLGPNEILAITSDHVPTDVSSFIGLLALHYPDTKEYLWATARENLYELDAAPPGVATSLHSSSHVPYVETADATATIGWTRATDDWSGVEGYAWRISSGSAQAPYFTKNLDDVTSFTTEPLAPSTDWYFTIRAHDRDGKWSASYATYGPMRVRAPFSADVRPWPDTGWSDSIVPRATADATTSSVPAPTTLTGESAATYYNLSIQNTGEEQAPYGWTNAIYIDGVWATALTLPTNLNASAYYKWVNRGPLTVRGGRHIISVYTDSDEVNSEMNEFDNRDAAQWVWSPYGLPAAGRVTRAHPPALKGGALIPDDVINPNCDGLRITASLGTYRAVWVRPTDLAADYDCRLHTASSGASSGFDFLTVRGHSDRGPGCLDLLFVRPSNAGSSTWDIGVLNINDHWCDYVAGTESSTSFATGSPLAVTIPAEDCMILRHFSVPAAGGYTIGVDHEPALGPLHVVWLSNAFALGDLGDVSGTAVTGDDGHAEIAFTATGDGVHAFALYRDPLEAPTPGAAPSLAATVLIRATPADLTPNTPVGWAFACVPRAADDGTPTSVPEPVTLTGDAAATWFNLAWRNAGVASAAAYYARTYVDGVQQTSVLFSPLAAAGAVAFNLHSVQTVPAGRHTLGMRLDPDGVIPEMSDANNAFGRQWVWTPADLARRIPVIRAAPPEPLGGLADAPVDTTQTVICNCDGVRMPAPAFNGAHGWWQAVATMPGAASDVDPRLHEIVAGARYGFRGSLVASSWGTGHSDFVLANYRATSPARGFDVGVLRSAGTEPYTVEAVASTYVASNPDGQYGPYNLSATHIINLHEVGLVAGPMAIGIHELQGDVDWGVTLYRADLAFQAKTLTADRDDWIAWMRPPGEGEWLVLDVPETGYYCVAVWKAGAADLAKNGQYQLEFVAGVTGTPEAPPRAFTGLVAVQPNPFNPRTAISYRLASAGRVGLAVYDVQGRRVRRLLDETRPAGIGSCEWDGTNDRGQALPSGVYLVRLETAAGNDRRAVTLLK